MNGRRVVVDASLALKWVVEEPHSRKAEDLLAQWEKGRVTMMAPSLFLYEVTTALRARVARGEMKGNQAREGVEAILEAGPALVDQNALHWDALKLAMQLRLPDAYGTHYLALAESEDCELWTGSENLWNAARMRHPRVRWVGEHVPTDREEAGGRQADNRNPGDAARGRP